MSIGGRVSLVGGVAALSAAAAILTAGAGVERAGARGQDRPNVIVVMSDDQTANSMRFMPRVRSRIGARGATFPRNFANWPLCCPSRATYLTGQYVVNHGVRGNSPNTGGGYLTFKQLHDGDNLAVWMRDAGYRTAHVGKYLNGYALDDDPVEVPDGWDEWYAPASETQIVYDYELNENGTLVPYGTSVADFKGDVITGKAVDFIEDRAPRRRPFFLSVGYTAPHGGGPNPNEQPPSNCNNTAKPAPRHADSFNGEPLPLPDSFNEPDVTDKPQAIQNLTELDAGEINQLTRKYRCRIESLLHIDEGVGEMLDALKAEGELGNTLVVYTSDNGFFHGEHRIRNGKNRVYEEAIRVPLLIRGPGIPSGVTVRELAVNADLASTVLDVADAEAGLRQDGRSLIPLAKHPGVERGRELLIEKGAVNDEGEADDATAFTAIRNRRYVYAEYGPPSNARELYDLRNDPFQLQSLHADPAYDDVEAALAERLAALRTCSGRSCRSRPELRLDLEFERGHENGHACAERPVRARVIGPDRGDVERVSFEINGEGAGSDDNAPFERRLSHSKLNERNRATVGAVVEMIDGRRVTLSKTVRACG